ncbi:MAG: ABC transporter ATP-binding protein [Chloroflexi bacterium]|nr:ABC transporter ATP-binding protein [Chloroflexota bacterium]MYF79516.1 ABC transporter ATP-binding protein [Chloroflexota bacterium]MYK61255.1 ABC transporter ATP-binding protein [Chloroflexota bacterium]
MSQTQVATENLVHVSDLVKDYDELRAVDGIGFDVKRGETFGLLGPNGAGKTTTMRMLAGLSPATDGSITVAGMDVAKSGRDVRNVIGVVTQHDGLDNSLVVHRNLEMHGYLAGLSYREAIKRTKEVLGFFNLESRANASIHALSGGMKRRLAIARAMMASPQLLVMDEPTTGLDPQSRNRVWEQLGALKESGVTIIMSTHYMIEAETLCDRLAIMDHGNILDIGEPDEVVRHHVGAEVAMLQIGDSATREERAALRRQLEEEGRDYSEVGPRILVTAPRGTKPDVSTLTDIVEMRVTYRPAHLEDVFLVLTGRELRDE